MGDGFAGPEIVAELSDDTGWWDHSNYSTLRVGDIDGDGAEDLCVRANRRVLCYRFGMGGFSRVDGPALSDESGWNAPRYYTTLRLADVNGDGRDDLCARAAAGPRCWVSTGTGFAADAIGVDGFTQSRVSRYSGFRIAGPHSVPLPESCNGVDDDLDGETDEEGICDGPPPTGGDGGIGPASPDGGVTGGDGGTGGGGGSDPGGVSGGCSASGPTTGNGWVLLLMAVAFVVRRRRD
jgi:MYXO-CTERM domain-containing protein